MTKAGLGGEHDAGVNCRQGVVIQTHARKNLGWHIHDHHISILNQTFNNFGRLLVFKVEGQAALVKTSLDEYCTVFITDRANETIFAAAGFVDTDDVGPQPAEQRCTIRPGNVAREIQHPNAVENFLLTHNEIVHPLTANYYAPVDARPSGPAGHRW